MENFTDVKYILDGFLFVFAGILVMWMAAGFAMLESGLTRTKNTATVLTKNIALFAISCIMFYFVGYNFMYGDGGAFIGSGAMLSGKQMKKWVILLWLISFSSCVCSNCCFSYIWNNS